MKTEVITEEMFDWNRIKATEFRKDLKNFLNDVEFGKMNFLLMRHGKPIAILAPIDDKDISSWKDDKFLSDADIKSECG